MCTSGAMYLDEDDYKQEQAKKQFYNKGDNDWDYYSNLPSVKSYE